MREIKFRGKDLATGDWVYGIAFPHDSNIFEEHCTILKQSGYDGSLVGTEVDPATVGQFTGAVDGLGVDIYEGDKVYIMTALGTYIGTVIWDKEECGFKISKDSTQDCELYDLFGLADITVEGTVYDKEKPQW